MRCEVVLCRCAGWCWSLGTYYGGSVVGCAAAEQVFVGCLWISAVRSFFVHCFDALEGGVDGCKG